MTLPDQLMDLIASQGGELRSEEGEVYSDMASMLNVDEEAVRAACSRLVGQGLMLRAQGKAGGRYVRLTTRGEQAKPDPEARALGAALRSVGARKEAGDTFQFEKVEVADFERGIKKQPPKTPGGRLVEAFLESGEQYARTHVDLAGAGGWTKFSRQVAMTVAGLRKSGSRNLTARVHEDGTVYIGDVIA